jgi:glycosyltransferase involved in cell wall biosynthesis
MNSEHPLVSIMIPTYNQPDFLPEAVESALAQSYPNLEVIISDDGSTSPACRDLLAAFEDTPRVRVYRNKTNLGRVGNYQKTLYERARGEWVLNLDGDDYFIDPTFIEQAARLAQAHPDLVMVSGAFVDRSPKDRLKPSKANSGPEQVYSPAEAFEAMLEGVYFPFHGSTLYRRQTAINIGFYQHDIISADLESLLRLMLTGHAASIPCEAMVRRRHGGNVSNAISVADFLDDTITFSAPLRTGSAVEVKVEKAFLRDWVARYTFHKGKDNAYKILKHNRSNAGYFAYVRQIVRCEPKSGVRIIVQPKNLLKILRNMLPPIT